MFDGKRFLPDTGTPIWKIERMSTEFAVCEPDPFAVATCKEKSLTTTPEDEPAPAVVSVRTLDMDETPPADRPRPGDVTRRRPGVEESGIVRLLSLCPSITESLAALGAAGDLVGITRYCVHPAEALKDVLRVGGTKNPDLAAIRAAKPDLVFCNAEENRGDDIAALTREFAVDVSHPRTVAEIPALLRHFGAVAGRREESEEISLKVEEALERVEEEARFTGSRFRFVYLIWKDPWMTVGPRTYVADLLRRVGGSISLGESSIADVNDYPVVSENAILLSRPDVVILPDEPYPFKGKDEEYWRQRLPSACRVVRVAGDDFCWHGVRTLRGLVAAAQLARPLSER
jgi:iron complex transport system substrate-binding protein